MFRINEAYENRAVLTVKNGEMTVHITLGSQKIVNLYPGLAEDAQKEGAVLLQPTEDEVTYSDGLTETVNGFDVPVPYLDKEFDLALIGKKGKWYDHKVFVSNPVLKDEAAEGAQEEKEASRTYQLKGHPRPSRDQEKARRLRYRSGKSQEDPFRCGIQPLQASAG